jgi:hypothetical protein
LAIFGSSTLNICSELIGNINKLAALVIWIRYSGIQFSALLLLHTGFAIGYILPQINLYIMEIFIGQYW